MTNAEIDRMIAEKIMGYTLPNEKSGNIMWYQKKDKVGNQYPIFLFNPSTNIAHAFEALEFLSVAWELYRTDANDYSCNIYDNQKQCFINGGYAKTKEMAICLSVLKCMEK